MSDNKKITDLTALTTPFSHACLVPVVDISGNATTKKITVTDLMTAAPVLPGDLGTAAATDTTAYATAAEGLLAGTATQPADLGTAAALNTGTTDGDVVLLDSTGLPAVDGSQLTGVTAAASSTRSWNELTGTSYTILSTDAGKILRLTDASLITVEVPAGLGVGFTCDIIQGGTGQILLEPVSASGVTLFGGAPGTHLYTEGQHCQITLTIDNTGAVGYSTGQVSPLWVAPATAAYLTLSNMSGSSARFDDYSGTLSAGMGSYPSWGTYDYVEATVSQLAGKYLKYTIANNATMQTDIQTAFTATAGYGITGWMSSSPGSGSLYAVYNTHIELATTGPLYVYSGTGGTSPTTITDPTTSISFIPIIYGVDWNGSSGGPKWGMTFVYNESGYVEESYDVYGSYNSSMGQLYASNVFGSSSSTTQSAFSADGGDTDTSGSRSYTPTFTGDMA